MAGWRETGREEERHKEQHPTRPSSVHSRAAHRMVVRIALHGGAAAGLRALRARPPNRPLRVPTASPYSAHAPARPRLPTQTRTRTHAPTCASSLAANVRMWATNPDSSSGDEKASPMRTCASRSSCASPYVPAVPGRPRTHACMHGMGCRLCKGSGSGCGTMERTSAPCRMCLACGEENPGRPGRTSQRASGGELGASQAATEHAPSPHKHRAN